LRAAAHRGATFLTAVVAIALPHLSYQSTSSAVKGETLSDSVRALACYADVCVLRHPTKGSAAEAASACPVPLLNAGDGVGEHPTQALLDLATIRGELGGVAGKHIVLVGDLKNGRTVHSLARLLAVTGAARVTYVAPPELGMPSDLRAELEAAGLAQCESNDLLKAVETADVVYVTRVQKERFSDADVYERLRLAFVLTPAHLAAMPRRSIVMHPLPRVGEITPECDADPRAAYFRQMKYGLYVRMALLALVLGFKKEHFVC
jgi:aspartate carbamoyltransferase